MKGSDFVTPLRWPEKVLYLMGLACGRGGQGAGLNLFWGQEVTPSDEIITASAKAAGGWLPI